VTIRLAILVCTFGYVGYSPIAPGTIGSIAGLAVYALMRWMDAGVLADTLLIVTLFVLGTWSGTHAERYFTHRVMAEEYLRMYGAVIAAGTLPPGRPTPYTSS